MATQLNYAADMGMVERAPFSVKVDPNKPPGDRFKDYIPRTPQAKTKADDSIQRKTFMRAPVARYTEDYVSGPDSAVRRGNEKQRIV